jgi:hypothetical protein
VQPFRFVPYHRLDGRPNIVVDGSATDGTVLTVSHWPGTPTPDWLWADLSAEMAVRLVRAERGPWPGLVSNNHFDQDGLMGIFVLVDPQAALGHVDLLIDVASAGDFATYRNRDAARVAMALAAYSDPDRSPVSEELGGPYPDQTGFLYEHLLPLVPELLTHPDRWRALWEEEDALLAAHEEAIASGRISVEEVPELDLAVVTVPDHEPLGGGYRFTVPWHDGIHPMAINNATDGLATLQVQGHRYELTYRYESWVQLRSRRPRPRVDLAPLAESLSVDEPGEAHWAFDGVGGLSPRLHLVGADESAVAPEAFRARLVAALRTGPAAWDPYAIDGAR